MKREIKIIAERGQDNFNIECWSFIKVCVYKECIRKGACNTYKKIHEKVKNNQNGIYMFLDKSGEVLYVGASYSSRLLIRLKQHFRKNDSAGLRFKLNKRNSNEYKKLKNSFLYVAILDEEDKHDICIAESYLIGEYSAKWNFV